MKKSKNTHIRIMVSIIIVNSFSILANQSTAMGQGCTEELVCAENVSYGKVTFGRMQPERNVDILQTDHDDYY